MAYTDQTKIEALLQRTLTAEEVALLVVLIPAIKFWIDTVTSSTFDVATETSRRYDGGVKSLDIDPCTDITAVTSLETDGTSNYDFVVEEEWLAEPVNETVKREIRRRNCPFPSGVANIQVTAKFSEYVSAVPDDIVMIATRIAASIIRGSAADAGSTTSSGILKRESLEGHSVEYSTSQDSINTVGMNDPIVQSVLSMRKEPLIG